MSSISVSKLLNGIKKRSDNKCFNKGETEGVAHLSARGCKRPFP